MDTTSSFTMADAAVERYVYDGDNVVLDFLDPDGDGTGTAQALKTRYLHGPNVDQILAQEDAGNNAVLWQLGDHLGTVRDVIESDGDVVAHIAYDSFGRVTSVKDSGGDPTTSPTRYLFTGREFDSATGLQYNRARWYDAATGNWISEDPIGFGAGDVNLARYAFNAAAMIADPSGLAPPWETKVIPLEDSFGFRLPPLVIPPRGGGIYTLPDGSETVWGPSDGPILIGKDRPPIERPRIRIESDQHARSIYIQDLYDCGGVWMAIAAPGGVFDNAIALGAGVPTGAGARTSAAYPTGARRPTQNVPTLTQKGNPKPSPIFTPPTNPPGTPTIPGDFIPEPLPGGGIIFRPPGSTTNLSAIRVMPGTSQYPDGYYVLYNHFGQPINPLTGKPGPGPDTHVPLPPNK